MSAINVMAECDDNHYVNNAYEIKTNKNSDI